MAVEWLSPSAVSVHWISLHLLESNCRYLLQWISLSSETLLVFSFFFFVSEVTLGKNVVLFQKLKIMTQRQHIVLPLLSMLFSSVIITDKSFISSNIDHLKVTC